MLLMAVLLMSCNTSKEILYFQDINVNQPEVISGARDITVQPKDQISILVSSKDPQLAALFNLARAQVRVGTESSLNTGGEVSGYTLDDKGNIDFPVLGTLHICRYDQESDCCFGEAEIDRREFGKRPCCYG